ncbi:MAG: hypothetical protein WDA14_10715 [Sphaerochaetaceae bacterium]|jgi:hypothetical protein|nr:hypothetical protein [Sphaerochaetaceae bacterium]NLO61429.1 hypothetical protein [Spirochaetales bacterium]MDD3669922.1 hypothetical protein [Sphaerochaetaceae bacterium]MDD4258559.1 hypothetical protein [Sphaerochaetaceae bacterium]MDD4763764.1 hypothetical protein [Sphaerochaetaceae bacterium]
MQIQREQPIDQLPNCSWFPFSDEPVLQGLWYVPRLEDPAFLFPEESTDGKWHLFAHSWLGIHHFISSSGIVWEPSRLLQIRGRSPSVYREKGVYYLVYEKHGIPLPFIDHGKKNKHIPKTSHIEMRSSNDLIVWSEPRLLLDSKDVPQASDYRKNPILSFPRLAICDAGYRLYFGSSEMKLEDSGEKVHRYICSAISLDLSGPYEIESVSSMMESIPNDKWRNLACGNLAVIAGKKGYAGFQTGIYWDQGKTKSASAIVYLISEDGKTWQLGNEKAILVPADNGWASDYITACDVRYKEDEDCWYCYFSASGGTTFGFKRGSIGLLIGKDPTPKKPITI